MFCCGDWPSNPVWEACGRVYESDEETDICNFAKNLAVIVGDPWIDKEEFNTFVALGYEAFVLGDCGYWWCECLNCGKFGLEFEGRSERLCDCITRSKTRTPDSERLLEAYTAARSARFEHGSTGAAR